MDTEKMNIIKKIYLGGYPESLCFSKENIYVTNSKKNQIDVIEKKSLSVVNNIKLDFTPDLIKVINK
jgi:DNA-binding beta-propeller fold protein YncE